MNDSKNNTYRVTFYNENGKAIEDSTGIDDSDVVLTKVEIEAAFPGGPAAWARYISRQIQNNTDEFTDRDYGTCFVKFIVDTKGHISSVHAMTMAGTTLAKVAVNAIVSGPAWMAAQVNGKYVKAFRIQPVTLTDPGK